MDRTLLGLFEIRPTASIEIPFGKQKRLNQAYTPIKCDTMVLENFATEDVELTIHGFGSYCYLRGNRA
jgi:hypothetical protein